MTGLNRLKITQKAEALALGVAWSDDRLVAVHEDGSAIRPEWHTAATILPDSGASVPAAAKWLGHDPAILLRVYGHVYDEALESAGAALFGGAESATGT
ncbi:hypothetical protein [Nocardia mangyaensis]|uniref:hypothetical protein n=1 Tax=Nocardia mangyaensis TaxID=2213200 RepID=UPI0026757FB4|nr:hypothetical protein [Nocardia mangyaensis]MDO3648653.1 hypothetical protein [Nocardia mangyaensis]